MLKIAAKVADALDYAHKQGIIHRDISPANIMLLNSSEAKVTDFGIARMVSSFQTKSGVVMGSPSYMSPEQIAGEKVDGHSDLFSLGVTLYELLMEERLDKALAQVGGAQGAARQGAPRPTAPAAKGSETARGEATQQFMAPPGPGS